jgi:hypothetical protein
MDSITNETHEVTALAEAAKCPTVAAKVAVLGASHILKDALQEASEGSGEALDVARALLALVGAPGVSYATPEGCLVEWHDTAGRMHRGPLAAALGA